MNPIESLTLMQIKRLLILIFPVSIIVDLISGFCTVQLKTYIPIGQVFRVIIMAAIVYLLLKKARPMFIWLTVMPFLFFIFAASFWIIFNGFDPGNGFSPGIEIENFSKLLYLFMCITFFIVYREEIELLDPLKIISSYGFLISAAVIISFITGFGNKSYGSQYGFGSKSYFKAINDLGLTILYCAVVSTIYLMSKFQWKRLLILLTISSGALLLGSRVGLIGIIVWLSIFIGYFVFFFQPRLRRMRRRFRLYKLLIFSTYIICLYNVLAYLFSIFDKYMLYKYTATGLQNARSLLTEPAEIYITNYEWYEAAFGKGLAALYYFVAKAAAPWVEYRVVEADFHELLGGYGLLGFVLFISPFFFFLLKAVKRFFSHPDFTLFAILFVTASFLAIAFAAGHCFRNPMVAPVYAYIVSLLYYGKKSSFA